MVYNYIVFLDIVICIFALASIYFGWRTGFLRGILGLVSGVISLVGAFYLAKPLEKLSNSWFHLSAKLDNIANGKGSLLNYVICFIVVYIIIRIIFYFIGRIIKAIKDHSKTINFIDKTAGIALGAAKCAVTLVIAFIILYALRKTEILESTMDWLFQKSVIGTWIYNFVEKMILPYLGSLVAATAQTVLK